jgi:hypothetical protein
LRFKGLWADSHNPHFAPPISQFAGDVHMGLPKAATLTEQGPLNPAMFGKARFVIVLSTFSFAPV